MYTIVTYSYLIIPISFILSKCKITNWKILLIALYGIIFFGLLSIYYETPKDLRKYLQAFYTFLEYLFFTIIFWNVIQKRSFRNLMILFSVLFISFQLFYVSSTSLKRLDSIPIGIESIFVFLYIFIFFFEYSKYSKNVFIYNHYCFWIGVGILIYLGGSFFFYLMINHLTPSEIEQYGNLTYVAEIIKNLLFGYSLFVYKKYNSIHTRENNNKTIPNLDL